MRIRLEPLADGSTHRYPWVNQSAIERDQCQTSELTTSMCDKLLGSVCSLLAIFI